MLEGASSKCFRESRQITRNETDQKHSKDLQLILLELNLRPQGESTLFFQYTANFLPEKDSNEANLSFMNGQHTHIHMAVEGEGQRPAHTALTHNTEKRGRITKTKQRIVLHHFCYPKAIHNHFKQVQQMQSWT